MKNYDAYFIQIIKEKIPNSISVTEEIASTLGISYDAAYRRLSGKVNFQLNEAVVLSKKYDISLNTLFEVNEPHAYLIRESKPIGSIDDFATYFSKLYAELSPLIDNPEASLLFGARELPMFYFFNNPLLIRFKMFLWANILNIPPIKGHKISFRDFEVSKSLILAAQKVYHSYNQINITEVWSFGSLNNVLQQLLYIYKMRQITQAEAKLVCDALTKEIKSLEEGISQKQKKTTRQFQLYSNELIMMNNSMIIKLKDSLQFAYPYALLRFFIINNQKASKAQEAYIYEQMQHATCITNTSTKERFRFFNRKYEKIKQVLKVIDNEENKPLFL